MVDSLLLGVVVVVSFPCRFGVGRQTDHHWARLAFVADGGLQFKQPIINFQTIQNMIADMVMELELMRMLAYRAASSGFADIPHRITRVMPRLRSWRIRSFVSGP